MAMTIAAFTAVRAVRDFLRGEVSTLIIIMIIPRCRPDSDSTWLAPVSEKSSSISSDILLRSPSMRAEITALASRSVTLEAMMLSSRILYLSAMMRGDDISSRCNIPVFPAGT